MMKKRTIIHLSMLLFTINVFSQGIEFDSTSNWKEIKEKAKAEKKNIFIDFYATWCGPCKIMDSQVYCQRDVGEIINKDFISIKVQTDKTSSDNSQAQAWYSDAAKLASRYSISAMPTLLFIKPDGTVLNSAIGVRSVDKFKELASDALNPERHYGKLKVQYNAGKLDISLYPLLASKTYAAGERELGLKVLNKYKAAYLDKMSEREVLQPVNLKFLLDHRELLSSKDRIFKIVLKHPEKIATLLKDLANDVAIDIIDREEIQSRLWKANEPVTPNPDWNTIESSIRRKYGQKYVDLLIRDRKLRFYTHIGNWTEYVTLTNEELAGTPIKPGDADRSWDFNNRAWMVFLECKDVEVLKNVERWSELTINAMGDDYKDVHNFYDTRANLLHKLGRTPEAIVLEKRAIDLKQKFKTGMADYKPTLEKMEKGIKTW